MPHPLGFEFKKRANLCSVSLEPRRNKKLVNGKQHSVWFVPTGMKGLPQNVLLNFRLEFPKSDLTIYLPSGISDIFCQMESTPDVTEVVITTRSNRVKFKLKTNGTAIKITRETTNYQ